MPELSRFPSGLIVRIHRTKDEEGRPHIHGFLDTTTKTPRSLPLNIPVATS